VSEKLLKLHHLTPNA